MKTPRIANAVGHIDDDLISEAVEEKQKKRNPWMKWGSLAACFVVLIITSITILPSLFRDDVTPGGNDKYKDYIVQGESGIVWPWEYLTIGEKYTELKLDSVKYISYGRTVSAELVDKKIETHTVVGYDWITEEKHTQDFEVYSLKYADKSQFVAVKMENAYYVFKKDEYDPPKNLGELFSLVDLPNAVELSHYSENGDDPSKKHYNLNDDDFIWNILADCKSALFVKDDNWRTTKDKNYISFTITSETLGVYKVAMYITEDGYLWTNAFSYQYLFDIGEEAAFKIINYAKENSTEAEYEPYQKAIAGKVVEITEDYILVDDSSLCNNPEDGTIYKVMLNDQKISRYVDHEIIKIGSTVSIVYEGEIDEQHTINTAISASNVVISGGDVLIPE